MQLKLWKAKSQGTTLYPQNINKNIISDGVITSSDFSLFIEMF